MNRKRQADVDGTGRFDGQVALITGAANGIGRATAARFASEGARVASIDIDEAGNASLMAEVAQWGGDVMALTADVRSREDQEAAVAEVMKGWGRIDTLVANAGIYVGGPLADVPPDRWADIMGVNLTGVMTSNSLVAPIMIQQGRGTIVNVASMAAKTSWPQTAEYSASKSGVLGITRSAAMELGLHGITVNAVCPGNTLTAMVRKVASEIGSSVDLTGDEWLEMRARDTALKRLAQPEEIAGVIAFLASEDARYLTGQAIEVDGGLILS